MTDIASNYAKGGFVELLSLPFGTDEIVIVLIQASGLPTDATLKGCQYLSDVLAAGAVEANFTNYNRIHISTPATIVVNPSGAGTRSADIPDQIWNGAGGAVNNVLGAFLICWRKTTSAPDSATRFLTKHGYTYTTTGGNLPASIPLIGSAT